MTTFENALKATLLLAVECETLLFQVQLDVDQCLPEASQSTRRELARQVVEHLLDKNWVAGYTGDDFAKTRRIDTAEFRMRLSEPNSWEEPTKGDVFWSIVATDQGETHYWQHLDGLPTIESS